MLAVLGLLGSAYLSGTASSLQPDPKGSDAQRAAYDTIHQTSDDPNLNFLGYPNPVDLRMNQVTNIRNRDQVGLAAGLPDIQTRQAGIRGGVLRRDLHLLPEQVKGLQDNRYAMINPDLPFTGWNNSNNNYHIRWARSLPRGMHPGLTVVHGSKHTFERSCGTKPPVDNLLGVYQEPTHIYCHGGPDRGTGRYFNVDGTPVFTHMF
jgi:hypothetical protein